ncbi:MAG: DnaD domain protein [Bacilli bacterium]|nr:DnaD domain protein [Bacilli bacterium]MDD4077206.1 DnaD domain protein [Bacilli bacterium]MDD4387671.1 DnaD domain protein [Bacilli bacterium]
MELTVNGIFKIQRHHYLGGEDYRVLTQMYLPIIGIDGFGLYHLLCVINEKETITFKTLLDTLNFPSLSYLNQAFSKLEAVSLIDAYYNKHKKAYFYQVKAPLSSNEFMAHPLLFSFLRSQLGEIEVNKLKVSQSISTRGYKNITRAFDQVYNVTEDNIKNVFEKMFNFKTNDKQIKVDYDNFDYIFFKLSFNSDFIDPKLFDDEEFKQNILNIAFMYKLNEEEMIEIIKKTITIDKDLKYSDLSKNARILYQKKYKTTEPRFVTQEPDAFLGSLSDDDTYRFLEKIETVTPADLLTELSGIKPAVSELKMIEDLVNNTKFPLSVINIMILWICYEKEGEIPGYNYFEKIANTWARANIKTSLDALKHINKEQKAKTSSSYQKGKKVTPLPDWYEKYQKQLSDLPKDENLTPEEIDNILSKMKSETK